MSDLPDPDSRDSQTVRQMFDGIARRYDLANHLLSGGIDFLWRRRAVKIVRTWQPKRILDLATGTGDLALALRKHLPDSEVTGADFSPEMLAVGRRKGLQNVIVADALQLPFEPESFDCVTVAFGLRNMADWDAALREMARVLTKTGHLLVLDFSMPRGSFRPLYSFYLHRFLPLLARLVTGKRDAYDYLGASIEKFPSGAAMTAMINENGFSGATAAPATGGIATIYIARKAASL
jgi:demethylmenaquinone methyltransferase/2-methoxy-6-polyprenyl-1,4-benzoquinol methylase